MISIFLHLPSVFSVYSVVKNLSFFVFRFSVVNTELRKIVLERQIDGMDMQIDLLVYELYGLNEEEIGIAEGPRQEMEGKK